VTVLHPGAWVVGASELAIGETGPSEGHLVARALAGERPALREIYELHAPRIQRFLRDLLGDRAAAADGTQETFARAFRRLHTLREGDRLTPWLFGIARNVCLELRKSRRRDRVPAPPATADRVDVDPRTPEHVLLGREAARLVDRALSRLSEDRRTALLLRADHGLAYDEIARLMRWSLSKAKVEIHRARLELRAELQARGGSER
jgi:RNA polymerase sigma-70 factor (ECF subfamily)